MDPNVPMIAEYENTRSMLVESMRELWKINNLPKTASKDKTIQINLEPIPKFDRNIAC